MVNWNWQYYGLYGIESMVDGILAYMKIEWTVLWLIWNWIDCEIENSVSWLIFNWCYCGLYEIDLTDCCLYGIECRYCGLYEIELTDCGLYLIELTVLLLIWNWIDGKFELTVFLYEIELTILWLILKLNLLYCGLC
jgi:hypothetical protein